MLAKCIYSIGMYVRNPDISRKLKFLCQSQGWTREELQTYQFNKLNTLLKEAYQHSPYYRQKFDASGGCPNDVRSLAGLGQVPPISKDELLQHATEIQWTVPSEKHFYSETSGSTGKPLIFYRNAEWDAWHRASVYRGYLWHGVYPWERNGYLWGYNLAWKRRLKTKLFDALQNRFRLFSYQDSEIDAFLNKLSSACFLSGYSSMIYELAKRVNQAKSRNLSFKLKMIKGTSEKIFDKYQVEVRQAFGRSIISEYGAAEAGIIAFECPQGAMHVNMETVIVEEVDNQILVTNLASSSFPIIRYKLGDYVRIDRDSRCSCGMQHEIIREVLGRVGKVIHGERQQYPSLTLYYVFKNLAMEYGMVLNYQATQSHKGMMLLRIEGPLTGQTRQALMKELNKYFSTDLCVDIKDNEELHTRKGKKADFVSELDL